MGSWEGLKELAIQLMGDQHFDSMALGIISFEKKSSLAFEIHPFTPFTSSKSQESPHLFDLASLTKPLLLSTSALRYPELFDEKILRPLLNHEASLPAGGRLSRNTWREQIQGYPIKAGPTLYSDYGALRLMMELEKKSGKSLRTMTQDLIGLDDKIFFWQDLAAKNWQGLCPATGTRHGRPIQGEVQDDNAYHLGEFCSHAGLFASAQGLCQTLLDLDKNFSLLGVMEESFQKNPAHHRFLMGWDTVSNPQETLAGRGAGPMTFGHLGFTGTSLWIDPKKKWGHVILTNATQTYSYNREGLNHLRRTLGEYIWKMV